MPRTNELCGMARAKVNLCLHITGKRADGFHLLDSLVVFPEIGDRLTVCASEDLILGIDGPFSKQLSAIDNSIIDAARILTQGRGAKIGLTKNLPVASGIGGGSSDAATALNLLAKLWELPVPTNVELQKLGADLPVCMVQTPQRMQGIGEKLSPVSELPPFAIVLLNAGISVPTGKVFASLENVENPCLENFDHFDNSLELFEYLNRQRNDMEPAAKQIQPDITRLLTALQAEPKCRLARMSGSGGTCFGLFETENQAREAAKNLANDHPDWWVKFAKV